MVPGDAVIVTSWLGNHSIHILSLREGLGFEQRVLSDCASLDGLVWNVLEEHPERVRCMRDVTRGGLGTVLNEVADGAGVTVAIERARLPIQAETAMAADMLGVDPLYLANEGCLCLFVDGEYAREILDTVRVQPHGKAAAIVGTVRERGEDAVTDAGGGRLRDGRRGSIRSRATKALLSGCARRAATRFAGSSRGWASGRSCFAPRCATRWEAGFATTPRASCWRCRARRKCSKSSFPKCA